MKNIEIGIRGTTVYTGGARMARQIMAHTAQIASMIARPARVVDHPNIELANRSMMLLNVISMLCCLLLYEYELRDRQDKQQQ